MPPTCAQLSGDDRISPNISCNLVDRFDELALKLEPLLRQLDENHRLGINDENNPHHQYWIGIAGGPGSGKSTTAEAIASRLNSIIPDSTVVIPMDGFHYTREKLAEIHGKDGIKRRGAPWTFDAQRCCDMIKAAMRDGQGSFPIYSREKSDPIEEGVSFDRSARIILVEGNYILHCKSEDWAPICNAWDEKWFVRSPTYELQRDRLIDRTLKTWNETKTELWGDGREGAAKRVDYNDTKNMKLIAYCEDFADEIIVTG